MQNQFTVGDVVILNSGGPKMTVTEVGTLGEQVLVRCAWALDDNSLGVAVFPAECVARVAVTPDVGLA